MPDPRLTEHDEAYLKINALNKRSQLYEITFGVCYGGEGAYFIFKFSKGKWHCREYQGNIIHKVICICAKNSCSAHAKTR